MKLLIINVSANTGSTGKISEDIGLIARQSGYEVRMAYGRKAVNSQLTLWRIGHKWDYLWHGVESRLWDNHGFASRRATKQLIRQIEEWKPDVINLHNLHGYYINVGILFNYLKKAHIPIVWTFHDCWPFTGHCSHFEGYNCYKWETECKHCPAQRFYPASWFVDRSRKNFRKKKELFNGLHNMIIVTPSQWLANYVSRSFLKNYEVKVIHNGVDLSVFSPSKNENILDKYNLPNKAIVLGVASIWGGGKGLKDFVLLRERLSSSVQIVLVGLTTKQAKDLPEGITAISRTENRAELAALYSAASVFVNPTYVDNFPTVNIEALACGTPVVTYKTGGSPEAIDEETGIIVEKGDIDGLLKGVKELLSRGRGELREKCRMRAKKYYDKETRYKDYTDLFLAAVLRNGGSPQP